MTTPARGTALHELVEHETAAAYADGWRAGYTSALTDVAGRAAELDDSWRPIGRATHEQRIAERTAEMEDHATRLAERLGRPSGYTYEGGPVPVWDLAPPRHTSDSTELRLTRGGAR